MVACVNNTCQDAGVSEPECDSNLLQYLFLLRRVVNHALSQHPSAAAEKGPVLAHETNLILYTGKQSFEFHCGILAYLTRGMLLLSPLPNHDHRKEHLVIKLDAKPASHDGGDRGRGCGRTVALGTNFSVHGRFSIQKYPKPGDRFLQGACFRTLFLLPSTTRFMVHLLVSYKG